MKKNNQLGLFALIKRSRPINLITGPIIYSMIFPLLFLDVFVSFYQWSCFPIYGIKKFLRKDYIIFDRQELIYLDWISKFHCTYCAYGVGLVAYVEAIIGATETYFCPIKHKSKKTYSIKKKSQYISFVEPDNFDFNIYLEKIRESNPKIDKS
jgi:hypothetical protein